MFTVYLALQDDIRRDAVTLIRRTDEAILNASSSNLRTALTECASNSPGVLVLDDALLIESPGVIESVAKVSYPIVLLADPGAPSVARRALAIRAQDVVPKTAWEQELIGSLRRVATPLEGENKKPSRVIGVFSSKGGVGKTTVSANLAVALGNRVHSPVVLVDLDVAFGDVAATLGMAPQATLHDLLNIPLDEPTVKRCLTELTPNVWILPAPLRPEEAEDIRADHLVKILDILKESFAYVVLDMAPGYDEVNVTALDMSDVVLTICTPDVVTLRTVGQALQLFREGFHYPQEKIRLVVNRSGSHTGVEVQDLQAILRSPVAYELPSEGSLPVKAANEGVPLMTRYPNSPLAKAIGNVADALIKEDFGNRRGKRRSSRRGGILPFLRR